MTARDVKQVMDALGHTMKAVKPSAVPNTANVHKFATGFVDRNGDPFTFYAYTVPGSRKIFLSDMGMILRDLQKSGMGVELGLMQSFLRTYDLVFTQDGVVVDMTDRPLWQRVAVLFQAWSAADGVVRTWTRPKG